MGCLHEGHLSLVREARAHADCVVVSVYVNPTQFAPHEDFDSYPRDLDGDRSKLQEAGCDVVFEPSDLYPHGDNDVWVRAETLELPLCGVSRPHFFTGVATVVTKLFNIVEPDVAVFGKKDYQQWRIISRMVRDLDFPITIIGMPIVREADGLAMSSRNARLTPDARAKAPVIYEALQVAERAVEGGARSPVPLLHNLIVAITATGGVVDYAEIVDAETLVPVDTIARQALLAVAVSFGSVRLIDNVVLTPF